MNPQARPASTAATQALSSDDLASALGQRVARVLSERTDRVNPDIGERLRVARAQALEMARVRRLALMPASAPSRSASGGPALAAEGGGWWGRLGTLLPALALALGLLGIQVWHEQTLIQAAAEIDVALLADDVPPDAYADPGFIEFLRESPR